MKYLRKRWQFWLGMGISLVLAALLAFSVDLAKVWAALRQMNALYLVPVVFVVLAIQVLRAFRWRLLFHPRQDLPITRLFNIVNIGYLLNNLPARAGDLARPVLLSYAEGTSVAGGLSTILIERILDTLTVVFLLFALLPFVPVPPEMQAAGATIAAILVVLTAALMLLSFQRELGRRVLRWLAERIPLLDRPAVHRSYDAVVDSLVVLRSPWPGLGILALTAGIWVLAVFLDYLVVVAFTPLPFTAAILVLCFTGLSMIVPASPGNIGTFHGAAMLALGIFGVEEGLALAIALVVHVGAFVPVSVMGLICMWAEGLSYGDITRRIQA